MQFKSSFMILGLVHRKTESTIQENTTENGDTSPKPAEQHLPATWGLALEKLKADLAPGESETQLRGTSLLRVTETAAIIGVPSANALAWLERRMYQQIAKALKGVVGKDLDLQFIAAS